MNYSIFFRFLFFVLSSLSISTALGQNVEKMSLNKANMVSAQSSIVSLKKHKINPEEQTVAVNWSSSHFGSTSEAMNSPSNESHFGLNYLYLSQGADTQKSVHFLYGLYPSQGMSYVALPEAYYSGQAVSKEDKTEIQYSFGRKYQRQSLLDESFNTGIMTPYFTQDFLNFNNQGLVGLTGSYTKDIVTFKVGYYPIYLPSQGPSFKEKNGELIFANRWATSPPKSFVFNGDNKPISYSIASYDLYDIANNSGFGGGFQIGDIDKKFLELQVNYLNTPMNDVAISRETYADIDLMGHVNINPVVRYSNKYSLDVLTRISKTVIGFSYLMDEPQNKLEKDYHAVQMFEPLQAYSVSLALPQLAIYKKNVQMSLIWAHFENGQIKDKNPDGTDNDFTFSKTRLRFKDPLKTDIKVSGFRFLNKPVDFKTAWVYDFAVQGSLFSMGTQWQAGDSLSIGLTADVIGLEDENKPIDENNPSLFIQQHKADDRITGDIKYVF